VVDAAAAVGRPAASRRSRGSIADFTPHPNRDGSSSSTPSGEGAAALEQKGYFRHTGYMGHERFTPLASLLAKHPDRVIERAVWGMLPKTTLSRQEVKQMLKVYAGPTHPHAAQQPQPLAVAR
jgi:hypothetical protein